MEWVGLWIRTHFSKFIKGTYSLAFLIPFEVRISLNGLLEERDKEE
jgi:hypothetical protein